MQPPDLIRLFENYSDSAQFAAGDEIFRQGESGDRMYVLLEGAVDLSIDGRHFDTVEPGGVFGEMAIIDPPLRSATAVARGDVRVASVDERRFVFMVQEHPYFALYVMRILADRIRKIDHARTAA